MSFANLASVSYSLYCTLQLFWVFIGASSYQKCTFLIEHSLVFFSSDEQVKFFRKKVLIAREVP